MIPVEPAECPNCGCPEFTVLRAPSEGAVWWGGGKARCQHCRTQFAIRLAKANADQPAPAVPRIQAPPEVEHMTPPPPNIATAPSEPGAVIFHPVRCRQCGSTDTRVTSTRRKEGIPTVRHHKCKGCGLAFQSVEDQPNP